MCTTCLKMDFQYLFNECTLDVLCCRDKELSTTSSYIHKFCKTGEAIAGTELCSFMLVLLGTCPGLHCRDGTNDVSLVNRRTINPIRDYPHLLQTNG